ncbi:hypothetical protein LTR66_007359 [Elasticomyces elasticus]|nr:hypothetical protein LTR66_007359 [Elasticomyces elasticus]KAK5007958.1 hypothetical protein LTR28_004626 [Elasticomyces elasticus]
MSASSSGSGTPSVNNVLPIQPVMTPAIGIAGAILLVTGIAFTLIGIKHKWMYIFLSTAFLTSLAVTVLVVYVMNPPVSNAIQGAYFVAACITGLVFGALSLVFREITEGLGSLFGGFCLAMWFLVLKPGGLVSSTGGRAVLIAVFSIAAFSSSFSHYTRTYGLIVSIAFGGATVTVLGIDFFSRAGLKEFWLYLWNLNDRVFPIGTNTYPITRGIRVEIAGIVIIFLLGLMSQFKIWNILKDRRTKKAADRLQDDENRAQLEAAVGQRVEESNLRDRELWEATYGDKGRMHPNHSDSGFGSAAGSVRKGSVSVKEIPIDGSDDVEMSSMRADKQGGRTVVTVCVASDDSVPHTSGESYADQDDFRAKRKMSGISSGANSIREPMERPSFDDINVSKGYKGLSKARSLRSLANPPPIVVPLPFSPSGISEAVNEDDAESVQRDKPGSKRSRGIIRGDRDPGTTSLLPGELQVPHIEEDRASSVAATADDVPDMDGMSLPRNSPLPSPYRVAFDKDELDRHRSGNLPFGLTTHDHPFHSVAGRGHDVVVDEVRDDMQKDDQHHFDEDDAEALDKRTSLSNTVESREDLHEITDVAVSRHSAASHTSAEHETHVDGRVESSNVDSAVGSLTDHLPSKMSKVAMTYRTNEWAKHLEAAEKPEIDQLSAPSSPGIKMDHGFADASAPRSRKLQPFSGRTGDPNLSRTASQFSLTNPLGKARGTTLFESQPVTPGTLSRSASASLNVQAQGLRSVSAPFAGQTLVESPVEEAVRGGRTSPPRNIPSQLGMANANTLLGQRANMMRSRLKSTSFNVASASKLSVIMPGDSASGRNVRLDEPDSDNVSLSERKQLLEDENMTLAERRILMQQRQRQGSWPLHAQTQHQQQQQQQLIYDSHQPKRTNAVDRGKQDVMLSKWRQAIQADNQLHAPLLADENRRQAMLGERRQVQLQQQERLAVASHRENAFGNLMRRGDMLDLHRDAMRKMQARAT